MDRGVRKAGAAEDKGGEIHQYVSGGGGLGGDWAPHYSTFWREKRRAPTESLHAWWFAQDGSEARSGARARGRGVVAWGGGVGLEARRRGFVILSRERESEYIHNLGKQALCRLTI